MSPLNQDKITNRFYIIRFGFVILLTCAVCLLKAQNLQGFKQVNNYDEQEMEITGRQNNVTIVVNSPLHLHRKGITHLVFYALPNGNSIEWTKGKTLREGDDWHFDIQHIAAQTRFVRNLDTKNNYIVVYLMTAEKSWPSWKRTYPGAKNEIKKIIDSITGIFKSYNPRIVLNGHSGGGSFIFGWLDAVEKIPASVDRIAFLDSNYGYEDSLHRKKLSEWLHEDRKNNLFVLAYNDSVVIYNGKPLVSPTGGTWYRSKLMQKNLAELFSFNSNTDSAFIRHSALSGRINIILKQNPGGLIYHTVQVEKNGFIYSLLSNTRFDKKKYFIYFGERAYEKFIGNE
jgi:hypothetical protein